MAPGDFKVMSHKMTNSLEIHTLKCKVLKIFIKKKYIAWYIFQTKFNNNIKHLPAKLHKKIQSRLIYVYNTRSNRALHLSPNRCAYR